MNSFYKLCRVGLALAIFLNVQYVLAQERTVSGNITDATDGTGLPGVNVVEKGTTNGTVTDFDGNYRLTVSEGATLVFSFVGYETQEIAVGARTVLDVALNADVTELSEVVVVGYGVQDKKEVTSAVTSIGSKDFNQGNVTGVSGLLQGKVSGLVIARPGGDPNEDFDIRLRGLSTLGANSEPLFVIDGVIGAPISSIDPNDIDQIEVLKDGSAAAIYGVRGSSGVIIITSKKGKAGKPELNYNGFVSVETIAQKWDVLDRQGYLNTVEAVLGAGEPSLRTSI
jgi:iron complex outermembrane receptor protein